MYMCICIFIYLYKYVYIYIWTCVYTYVSVVYPPPNSCRLPVEPPQKEVERPRSPLNNNDSFQDCLSKEIQRQDRRSQQKD